jgi:hypothetical protein
MVAVGDQRGAVESRSGAETNPGRELVPDEADHPGGGEPSEVIEVLRMNEPTDRFGRGDGRGREDRRDDRVPGPLLAALAPEPERDRKRNRGERIAASSATDPEST